LHWLPPANFRFAAGFDFGADFFAALPIGVFLGGLDDQGRRRPRLAVLVDGDERVVAAGAQLTLAAVLSIKASTSPPNIVP
jgi:hypothetical protein